MLPSIFAGLESSFPSIPICVHLDHGFDFPSCASAISLGFNSVMIDGTFTQGLVEPSDFQDNLRLTAEVTQFAHSKGISVEGALGVVGSLASCVGTPEDGTESTDVLSPEQLVTDLDQAVEFVEQTKVDALAVAVGTTHGLNKFQHEPNEGEL